MAIQWGGFAGHMRVGIDVFTDGYDTNTPSINVYADISIQCDSTWNFNDSQTLTLSGNAGGTWTFTNNLTANQTRYIGRGQVNGQGQNYNGGPTYRFLAQISGHYQGATPSADVYFTLPARPPNVPTPPGIGVDSVTANGARILVYAPDPRGAGIDAYQTVTSLPGANFGGWTNDFGGGTGTVSNLQPATVYQAATRAHNGVGWSDWAYSGQFTTGANPPGVPTSPNITNIAQTSAQANWTAPGNNGGSAISSYTLQVATDASFSNIVISNDVGNVTSYSITGLTPGNSYWIRVRANNGIGSSAYTTNTVGFSTLAGTPVILSPSNGGTLTSAHATVTLQALGIASDRRITAEFSQASDFASGVKTLILQPTGASGNNQYTLSDTAQFLLTGAWFVRAKVTNLTSGYVTPWSTTVPYTVSHAPVATIVSPTGGGTIKYTASPIFMYKFVDAGSVDAQTAYQLIVENNATNAVVFDSGKVTQASSGNNTVQSVAVAIASSLKNNVLRWKVRVWDKGNTASDYTGYALFTLADAPAVTVVTPPSAMPVDNGAPTFAWTVSFPSGAVQAAAEVNVYDASTNALAWTGNVVGTKTSVTPPVVVLRNAASYYFTLSITDSVGLNTTLTQNFTTSYSSPGVVAYTIDPAGADEDGDVEVRWTEANPDDLFAAWKVYRRTDMGQWQLLATIADQNTRVYRDFMLTSGKNYSYSVTQVATRSGILLESPVGYTLVGTTITAETRSYFIQLSYYWILNPDDSSLSLKLPNVVSDNSTLAAEKETYTIIGRGRHTDYGDILGYAGTVECQIRQPLARSAFRDKIEALWKAQETYYLRTPFGRLFKVSLGDLSWTPLGGVGLMEMGDMSIPYEEVN